LRQKVTVNRISSVKISSRPSSIASTQIHLPTGPIAA
jgi:hypothetical protein